MAIILKSRIAAMTDRVQTGCEKLDAFATQHEIGLFWILAIIYKFALDALYVWAASPQYFYAGLELKTGSIKYAFSFVMYLLLFAALPKRERSAASFLLNLQFVFTVAPMLSFYALADQSSRYMLMVFVCVLLQILVVGRKQAKPVAIHIKGIENYVTVFLGVLVVFALVIPVLYNGFEGLKAFNFAYIYEMRAKATYPAGFGYIQGWITNTIIPFAFLAFLVKKKYGFAAVAVVLQVLFYMLSGQKYVLFILAPLLLVYLLGKTGHMVKILYGGFILLCLGVLLAYKLDQESGSGFGVQLNGIVAIRAIFHPADNKFNFYECFNQLPKVCFSDGLIGKMLGLTYPYKGSIGQVVYAWLGGQFMSANMNTGYLGESYAQLGFLGMLAMSALLGLILRGLKSLERPSTQALLMAVFSDYFIILNDGALFTTLFSGGMFVAFILIFIYFGKATRGEQNGIQRA